MWLVTLCLILLIVLIITLLRDTLTGSGISPSWCTVARGGVLSAYGVNVGEKRVAGGSMGVSRRVEGMFMAGATSDTSVEHIKNYFYSRYSDFVRKMFGCALGVWDKAGADNIRAIPNINRMIQMTPDLGYCNRGLAYGGMGDFEQAISDFESVMRIVPNHGLAYYYRGIIYGKKGDFDRAISDFDTALRLSSDFTSVYYVRGLAYLGKGNFDRAIQDLIKAVEPNSKAEVYLVRGFVYGGRGNINDAIADFEAALRIEPNNAAATEFLEKVRSV
jgi:tetratricopeptide (TPR) repeat protein